MKNALSIAILLGIGCFEAAAQPRELRAKKPFVATTQYSDRNVLGWTLKVNHQLLTDDSEVGRQALALIEVKLREITERVPGRALMALQRVPIWLGVDDYAQPNACYHPSADWLRTHGWNPDKAKAVEIGNAAIFLAWSEDQPMMILHELAHAYHDQVLGFDAPRILDIYGRAKASGRYESVPRSGGGSARAYALNNAQEFFAEASEAYFGRNDFHPFTRADLQAHDPEMFRLLTEIWSG